MLMQEQSPETSFTHHHGNQSLCHPATRSMQRSKTCIEIYSDHRNMDLDPEFAEQITQFAEEKKRFLLRTSTNEEAWRESIRVQLEEELDRRVKDALNSPTVSDDDRERARKLNSNINFARKKNKKNKPSSYQGEDEESDSQLEKVERLNSCLTYQLSDQHQHHSRNGNNDGRTRKHWRVAQAERKLQRFLQQGQAPLATETTKSDYILNSDLLQYGGSHSQDSGNGLFGNIPTGIKSHSHYANVARKAERNFGSLTTVERFEFFYAFTKNGFKEAQRLGRLPDGSELKLGEGGKYKDKYGIVRDEHGPFWPSENGPMFPPPTCIKKGMVKTELVLDPENCEKYKQTVDNQPTPYTKKWRGVQIIFDSEKSGRNYEAPPVSEEHSKSLLFESRFESGNLRQARRIGEFEYELVLKTDLYTHRHTQWYYFQVKNATPGVTYKFKIVNLLKKSSLYNYGMRPLLYSQQNARTKSIGWLRGGHHISYYRNEHNLQCPLLFRDRTHYILEWQMEFPNADDTCYLAHCYPYTFTDLKDDLETLANDPERSKVMKQEVMCETRAGNSCFLITVTNFDNENNNESGGKDKKGVVVTARVHPGETNSSWMMKGVLDFITGKTPCAKELRNRFIFKIVPMLNPDGVIVGNYRCSLAGRDLNRNYRHPRKESFPTIWHTKAMMEELSQWNEVLIYCDLHGHSRKQNVFMYGCNQGDNKQQFFGAGAPFTPTKNFLKERMFPWLMAQKAPDKFSFRGCRFAVRKAKEATGRVVMFKQMEIENSFTMEATFCGTNICRGDRRHFNAHDFELMGRTFCEVVLDYNNTQNNKEKQNELVLDMTRAVAQQVLENRGMLPASLPDFTTEKGRELLRELETKPANASGPLISVNNFIPLSKPLPTPFKNASGKDYCQGRKGLSASEQYAFAFMNLVKKERDNITKSAITSITQPNAVNLSGSGLQKLLDMMCGENSDYIDVLDSLNVNDDDMGSDSSSDSDSESEPEMVYTEPKTRRKKKKHKKNKASRNDQQNKESKKKSKEERPSSTSALPSIGSKTDSGRKRSEQGTPGGIRENSKDFAKTFPGFVNKYIGRSNGGIPCFSEERLLARATKRMDEMKKRMEEEQMLRRDLLYYSDSGDNVVTVNPDEPHQRRVSYPQSTSLDLRSQLQQALERGFNVRTGYMHGYDGDSGSDSDNLDLSELRDLRHPVAALHSPYGNISPTTHQQDNFTNGANTVMGGSMYPHHIVTRSSSTAAPITAQILNAHNQKHGHQHVNVAPQKISRLPPLPHHSDTPYSADSCSIPLRHTTQGMTITPRITGEKVKDVMVSPTDNNTGAYKKQVGLPRDSNMQLTASKAPTITANITITKQHASPTSHISASTVSTTNTNNSDNNTAQKHKSKQQNLITINNTNSVMKQQSGKVTAVGSHNNIGNKQQTSGGNKQPGLMGINITPAVTKQATMATLQGEYSELLYKQMKAHSKSMTTSQITGHTPTNFLSRRKPSERHATCE